MVNNNKDRCNTIISTYTYPNGGSYNMIEHVVITDRDLIKCYPNINLIHVILSFIVNTGWLEPKALARIPCEMRG